MSNSLGRYSDGGGREGRRALCCLQCQRGEWEDQSHMVKRQERRC